MSRPIISPLLFMPVLLAVAAFLPSLSARHEPELAAAHGAPRVTRDAVRRSPHDGRGASTDDGVTIAAGGPGPTDETPDFP